MSIKLIASDNHLVKYGQSWPNVPLFINDGLLMPIPSEWSLDMTIQSFAKNTVISYSKSVAIWLTALDVNGITWDSVDVGTAQMFIYMLHRENVSEGTIKLRMTHIQEFYRWAMSKKYIERLPYEIRRINYKNIPSNIPALKVPNTPNRKVKAQSVADFEKILGANPRKLSSLSKRDDIIAEIARYMGLRRSEISNLRKEQFTALDLSQELQIIEIVSAKGRGRLDSVIVPKLLLSKIVQYIEIERKSLIKKIKKTDPSYQEPLALFLNERGKNRGQAINSDYIGDSWKRSAVAAGIESRFHDNRSSFATNAAKLARLAGENARSVVKDLLRHKSEDTASHYVEFEKMQSDLLMRARLINDAYNEDNNDNK